MPPPLPKHSPPVNHPFACPDRSVPPLYAAALHDVWKQPPPGACGSMFDSPIAAYSAAMIAFFGAESWSPTWMITFTACACAEVSVEPLHFRLPLFAPMPTTFAAAPGVLTFADDFVAAVAPEFAIGCLTVSSRL